ncbi:uncharacterized protein CC84DRAFT_1090790 [Paraphaeosphaeria sporulosa]|uniref:DUF2423 domain-containing protein n=1 Tax=Paraphaeosphaeria sporulosa TaxID=1460663 RepID=A0A177CF03_9PLEO|nr:uncharacterized protein CC84DRAFT_1090790 [Paraphaeosphaeria sporulosa]OAG05502.1 hypothetical protein CC84DRAFT_1090790 [Paraphaeosphaeria sporulosa]
MAKGLRSSSKKSNRTKLRARVFEPVENARLERIHQKLLETAQQPKPETAKEKEMDVDSAEDADAAANDASKEEDFPKGSFFLSASIPQSLCATSTSIPDAKPAPAHEDLESRTLYDVLGLCSDIVGFTPTGALEFAFDPLAPEWLNMDVDGERSGSKRKHKDRKTIHKEKMLRRKKPKNQISFPTSRGKGALKPFSESKVRKRRS